MVSVPDQEVEALLRWLEREAPETEVVGSGARMEIFKEVGLPEEVAQRFELASMSGTHAIGHTRMRPRLLDQQGRELAPALTVLLALKKPEESTAFFRFQVMKSADPRETYEKALRFLQAEYYQDPDAFNDRLLATMPTDARFREALVAAKRCTLDFAEGRWAYRLPCKVKVLKEGNADRDAALWHNRVFNPTLSDAVHADRLWRRA